MSARKPYTGSCHCGQTKYIVFLTLPPQPQSPESKAKGEASQEFYRCNCTACQKAGHFHVRTRDASQDIMFLAPLDPAKELGDYQWAAKTIHFYFCRNCGGRCMIQCGPGRVHERDLGELGVPGYEKGTMTKVWQPDHADSYANMAYASINGYTLDAEQPGANLVEWTDKKWVNYLECLHDPEKSSDERPFDFGAY